MKLLAIACLFMVVPFLWFYSEKSMEFPTQFHVYWIWEKTKDLLLAITLYLLSYRQFKTIPLVAIIWTSIRLLWHLLTITLPAYKHLEPLAALNQSKAIAILFLILATGLTVWMIVDCVKKWPKESRWLDG